MSCRTFSLSLPWKSTCRSSTISPSVSVPVLSVQRISTLPKSSIADSCLTRTFFLVIRLAPWASVTVMIMGIISGVIPTASATEKRKDSSTGRWKMMFTSRTKRTSTIDRKSDGEKERLQHRTMENDVHQQDEKDKHH